MSDDRVAILDTIAAPAPPANRLQRLRAAAAAAAIAACMPCAALEVARLTAGVVMGVAAFPAIVGPPLAGSGVTATPVYSNRGR
jgi:hypothetical protein